MTTPAGNPNPDYRTRQLIEELHKAGFTDKAEVLEILRTIAAVMNPEEGQPK